MGQQKGQEEHKLDAGEWLFADSYEEMSLWWICNWFTDEPEYLVKAIRKFAREGTWLPKAVLFRVDRGTK